MFFDPGRCAVAALLVVAACNGAGKAAPGVGPAAGEPIVVATCEAVQRRVEEIYRRESEDPHEVADNVGMAMADCRRDQAKVAPCLFATTSVTRLEVDCLLPLDDQGSEGRRFIE